MKYLNPIDSVFAVAVLFNFKVTDYENEMVTPGLMKCFAKQRKVWN